MRYPAAEKLEIIRLFGNPVCRYAERWTSSVSGPRDFTDGTTTTRAAGTRR